jgi:hypothetical protein
MSFRDFDAVVMKADMPITHKFWTAAGFLSMHFPDE